MALIGYARVSTDEQTTTGQAADLRAAGCTEVHEEHGSGGNRSRPVLNKVLDRIKPGDTLIVVRIDRLARSLSHLLEVIEGLEKKGAHFRSLGDPIDTSSPQGKFTLQLLGATAEFERSLIRDRTKAGLRRARSEGRVGGNPGVRSRDPAALKKIARARDEASFRKLDETAQQWVPEVRRLRPDMAWDDLVAHINARLPAGAKPWTKPRLVRAAKRYVREGLLEDRVLDRAQPKDNDRRLLTVVAAIVGADPSMTLDQIARRLEALHERTPRGRTSWQVSSVKMLVDRARTQGLLQDE